MIFAVIREKISLFYILQQKYMYLFNKGLYKKSD